MLWSRNHFSICHNLALEKYVVIAKPRVIDYILEKNTTNIVTSITYIGSMRLSAHPSHGCGGFAEHWNVVCVRARMRVRVHVCATVGVCACACLCAHVFVSMGLSSCAAVYARICTSVCVFVCEPNRQTPKPTETSRHLGRRSSDNHETSELAACLLCCVWLARDLFRPRSSALPRSTRESSTKEWRQQM